MWLISAQDIDWTNWNNYTIPAIGILASVVVFLLAQLAFGRPRKKQAVERYATLLRPVPVEDPFYRGSAGEKRASVRRKGNPVKILISDAEGQAKPHEGCVIDRSIGGLGMMVEEPVEVGTILSVRAVNAPASVPWVQIEVRNCRKGAEAWEIGCQFVRTPPWSVLLLFG